MRPDGKRLTRLFCAIVGCMVCLMLTARGQEKSAVIDDCRYADDAAAQAAWLPMQGTAPASVAVVDGRNVLRLRCNFAGTKIERASWDKKVQLNLTDCRGIQFKFLCQNAAPVSHFSVYFQSGEGWYATTFFPPSSTGWNTIFVDKAGMRTEGRPAGWGQIQTIRVSAWRGEDVDTEFYLSDISRTGVLGVDAAVAIVRADSVARTRPEEVRSVEQFAESVAQHLQSLGIGYATLSDLDVTAEQLQKAQLVVLPHNPDMPEETVNHLIQYLNGGGKLLAFYGLHARLRPVVKIDTGQYVRAEYPGHFAAMRFVAGALPGAPPRVGQRSWNIIEPKPVPGASRVVAEWLNDKGQPTGHAAIVASANGVAMSHVLLPDDAENKRRMLLAMVGSLVPEVWKQAADASIARIGQVAGYKNFDEAVTQISRISENDRRVFALLEESRRWRATAMQLAAQGNFPAAGDAASQAAQCVMDAYCTAQKPLAGEFRAFWCHSAFGVEGMKWDEAIKRLADNGFTAILPNMLWGGVAFYPSQVLPVAPEVAERGDQMAECVAACKKYGVQIHVWKVNWNLGSHAPQAFVEKMRREGRLQVSSRGVEERWLCPSHPDNQKLEINSMVEVARNYDVDGVHFDYIRYPDGDHCFCAGCKERFQRAMGVNVQNWPADVLRDGAFRQQWMDWRRSNITAVVKAVSEQVRAIKPKVKISAAVFRNWSTDRDTVGQDWKLWCEQGYLDFVCPMDYTESDAQFENWVKLQKVWAGTTPCYPGIGASASSSRLGPDDVIGQIAITRRHNTRGFILFNYGVPEARDLLPMLGKGITAKE